MSDGIDPVQFGRLLSSVETLTGQLSETSKQLKENVKAMSALDDRIGELESRYRIGKGVLAGIILGAGFAMKGIWDTLTSFLPS